jgi:hypothetical protein
MIGEIDLTASDNKIKTLNDFICEKRDRCGGLIMSLIIPPAFKGLMYNVTTKPTVPDSDHFYFYGWFDICQAEIYVDTTLTDSIYLIGNNKTIKIKVTNGQRPTENVDSGTSIRSDGASQCDPQTQGSKG